MPPSHREERTHIFYYSRTASSVKNQEWITSLGKDGQLLGQLRKQLRKQLLNHLLNLLNNLLYHLDNLRLNRNN